MRKTKVAKGPVIGGGESTGVFITKNDMDQLIEVIAKAKARDRLATAMGVTQIGGSARSGIEQPTIGMIAIQTFVRKLADTYGLPQDQLYGINKHGEFIRWVSISRPN